MPFPPVFLRMLVLITTAWLLGPVHAVEPSSAVATLLPTERSWVASHDSISMCVDPDWIPFERINERGQHQGIAADLVQLAAQRVGLKIVLYPVKTWEQSLAASKTGQCQIMSFLNQTPAREAWLIFTDPIFSDPNVIITRNEHLSVADLHAVNNESVALPRGTMVMERIGHEYPGLRLIGTGSEPESMDLVSERKADMTIRSLIVAAYTIRAEGLFNLKISGQLPEFTNQLRIGVLKDQVILRDILNKGVHSITPQEREAITNQHVLIQVQQGVNYRLVWQLVIGGALVTALILVWNRKLNTLNKQLETAAVTDKLTGLFNRVRVDEVFSHELERAQRYKQPFSIILADVDLFKQVNDTYGHQVGDQVLVMVAQVLRANTRAVDVVGRWGGEEFVMICPHTSAEGVMRLAETIRQRLQEHEFPIVQHLTASFGVTTYRPGDHCHDMFARADAALYDAKRNGRNQIKQR